MTGNHSNPPNATGTTVLLVDDEVAYADALAKRLSRRGLLVHTAPSAVQAYAVLAAEPVEVVVLDVRMPGTDGLTALEFIRREHPSVEVILLTGHASLEACTEGMRLGAFDCLLKPVDLEELIYKVQDAARQRALSHTCAPFEPVAQ